MAENMTARMQERLRINVDHPYELRYWSQTFNVSEAQVRLAIEQVGPVVKSVKEYFAKTVPPPTARYRAPHDENRKGS